MEAHQYLARAIALGWVPTDLASDPNGEIVLSLAVALRLGINQGCDATDDDYILALQDALQKEFAS